MSEQANMTIAGVMIPAVKADVFAEPIAGPFLRRAENWIDNNHTPDGNRDESIAFLDCLATSAIRGCVEMTALHTALSDTDQFFEAVQAKNGDLRQVIFHDELLGAQFYIATDLQRQGALPIERKVVEDELVVSAGVYENKSEPYATPLFGCEVIGADDETIGLVRLDYRSRLLNPYSIYALRLQKWMLRWGIPDSANAHVRTFATLRPHNESCGEFARLLVRDEIVNNQDSVVSSDLRYRNFHNLLDPVVDTTVSEFESGNVREMLQ